MRSARHTVFVLGSSLLALFLLQALLPATDEARQRKKRLTFKSLTVKRKLEVPSRVTRIEIKDDLVVRKGAAIESSGNLLALVVRDDVKLKGSIRSAGHLVLVDRASKLPAAAELEATRDRSTMGRRSRGGPRSSKLRRRSKSDWKIAGTLVAGDEKLRSKPSAAKNTGPGAHASQERGDRGRRGRGVNIEGQDVTLEGRIEIGDGGTGEQLENACGAVGGEGGRGGNLTVRASGRLTMALAEISGGNGGTGGFAEGQNCGEGQVNRGGKGGKPGTWDISSQGPLEVVNRVKLFGFNGGKGGDGKITGMDDDPGRSVEGQGGAGGDVALREMSFEGVRFPGIPLERGFSVPGVIEMIGFKGGAGAFASGKGGNGLPELGGCTPELTPTREGAKAGKGTAVAGDGGKVDVELKTDGARLEIHETSFRGGDAFGGGGGKGGNGGKGKDCDRQGAKGGRGGDAAEVPGAPGTSNFPGRNGRLIGRPDPTGGNGGQGGNAQPPPAIGSIGGNGGDGGCFRGKGGGGGTGATPGQKGADC